MTVTTNTRVAIKRAPTKRLEAWLAEADAHVDRLLGDAIRAEAGGWLSAWRYVLADKLAEQIDVVRAELADRAAHGWDTPDRQHVFT